MNYIIKINLLNITYGLNKFFIFKKQSLFLYALSYVRYVYVCVYIYIYI